MEFDKNQNTKAKGAISLLQRQLKEEWVAVNKFN